MVSRTAADAGASDRSGASYDNDHYQAVHDNQLSRPVTRSGFSREKTASAYANGMFILIRATSVLSTTADFAMWRFFLPLLVESKCRREACWRKTLPVPVILNRLDTAFRVLLRAMAFGIRRGR